MSSVFVAIRTSAAIALVTAAPLAAQSDALTSSAGSPTTGSRSNAILMANDHYTRSHPYDLIHQRIVLSDFNWDSTSFHGVVTTTLEAREAGLDSLVLDEGALLHNTAVVDRAGHALRAGRHGDTLIVWPTRPLGFGDTLTFTVTYDGHIESGHGLTFITSDGLSHRPQQIWSQGESQDNHSWFPTYDFPNDKMTWELTATVPSTDLAISNGRLVSNRVTRRGRTMTWNQDTPSATYLVSLIVAPLAKIHDQWHGIPVDYYTYHSDSARAWRLFHVTTDMIDVYSRLTGVPYPWAKYAQTTVADFFGGMENVSATTLVDWLPDARAYVDRPWYRHILIPHELAHQWFGDYVTTINWANTWLNEGFAEFMPGQYWQQKLGDLAAQDYYADEYPQYLAIESRRSMPLASLGSNNIYPKGALVLEMLKDYLGPERFWASLHQYLTDHAHGVATTDDLRQAVLRATGDNLDWFWAEWIYAAGHPKFTVTDAWDSSHARLTLHVVQTQRDTFTIDSSGRRFRTPAVFQMPVAIRIGFASGDRVYRAQINQRDQTIAIDSVTSNPTMVIFDDGNHILKELQFNEPTAALAEQLRRDHDVWNLDWVIDQLSTRTDDSTAAQAIADAALHADYFRTRVTAVNALSGFPPAAAVAALTAAARDTSAAVRAAAFAAMTQFGGATVATAAREAWQHDTSYNVRAAALRALARSDTAGIDALLRQALTVWSYRDAIQSAALQAAVARNDTSLVAPIETLLGDQPLAAQALAAMGARGNARALAALRRHLNDPRAGVRRRVVDAYQSPLARIDQGLARRELQAATDSLRYPDTRRDVAAALKSMR